MPVPQGSKSEVFSSVSVRDNSSHLGMSTIAVDEEEKYWKLKIVYSALESGLFSSNPSPNLPLDVLNRLRMILHGGGVPENDQEPIITSDAKYILMSLIAGEIENVSETIVKTQTELLKSSNGEESQEWLLKLSESENPLEELLKMVLQYRLKENEVDRKINEAEAARMDEFNKMEEKLNKVKQALENKIQTDAKLKQPEEVNRKFDVLKSRSDLLALKTELTTKEQLLLECPSEVMAATQATLMRLSQANEKLKCENDALSSFINQYDTLPSHLKDLLVELQQTDESIKRQEWILKSLNGYQEDGTIMEDSMEESFF